MARKPNFIKLSSAEIPNRWDTLGLAWQHASIVLLTFVYVVTISKALKLSPKDEMNLIGSTLLMTGLGSILQSRFGSRLLAITLPNPIYIPAVIAVGLSHGLAGVAFLISAAGLLEFAFAKILPRLRVLFPPEVCGVVITMLGEIGRAHV